MLFPNSCVGKGSKDGRELKTHQNKKWGKIRKERNNTCKIRLNKHNKTEMLHPYKIIYDVILDLKN